MLEQPSERSALEIEAAAAAAAQVSPQRRNYGCIRLLIWCMPTFLFYGFAISFAYIKYMLLHGVIDVLEITIFFVLVICSTFGLGYFDSYCYPNDIANSPAKRLRYTLLHAVNFTALQFLFIPVLTVLFLVAYAIVAGIFGKLFL